MAKFALLSFLVLFSATCFTALPLLISTKMPISHGATAVPRYSKPVEAFPCPWTKSSSSNFGSIQQQHSTPTPSFLVDNSPIRVFNNHELSGVPFPNTKPMRVYCSLWNADDWATQGGQVKTDWSHAPFLAYYRNFKIDTQAKTQDLDSKGRNRLRWVQQRHMVYNYCADALRFLRGTSLECKGSRF